MAILGTSEVARRLKIHPVTLHRWEAKGVLMPAMRDSSGKRLYWEEDIERFAQQRLAVGTGETK